jgi:hypothetical protein
MARPHQNPVLPPAILLVFCLTMPVSAQDTARSTAPEAAASTSQPAVLTGKERLGRKWMDEQRIDNCNVPIDKRGARPRPSSCHPAPTG